MIEEGDFESAVDFAAEALGVDGSAAVAAAGLKELAARGVTRALFPLALCALEGRGIAPDRAQGLELLEAAAAHAGAEGARARYIFN